MSSNRAKTWSWSCDSVPADKREKLVSQLEKNLGIRRYALRPVDVDEPSGAYLFVSFKDPSSEKTLSAKYGLPTEGTWAQCSGDALEASFSAGYTGSRGQQGKKKRKVDEALEPSQGGGSAQDAYDYGHQPPNACPLPPLPDQPDGAYNLNTLDGSSQSSTAIGEIGLDHILATCQKLQELVATHLRSQQLPTGVDFLDETLDETKHLQTLVNVLEQVRGAKSTNDMLAECGLAEQWRTGTHITAALTALPPTARLDLHTLLGQMRELHTSSAPANGQRIDFLFIVCSPTCGTLRHAQDEAHANAACAERAGLSALVVDHANLAELNSLLKTRAPRVAVFIGHADAPYTTGDSHTLCLTDGANGAVYMNPSTIACVFGGASERLELVVLNGCKSIDQCEVLSGPAYGKATVGWSTLTNDAAAKVFSIGLVECLCETMRLSSAPISNRDKHKAFEHAKRAVLAVQRVSSGGPHDWWSLVDPELSQRSIDGRINGILPDGTHAAGVPHLLTPPKLHDLDMPPPAKHAISRSNDLHKLVALAAKSDETRCVAVHGMGGSGKSIFAADAARSPILHGHFADGAAWAQCCHGATALNVMKALLDNLSKHFGLTTSIVCDLRDGHAQLAKLLEGKRMAIFVDDVWDVEQVRLINTAVRKTRSCLFITSRKSNLEDPLSAASLPLPLLQGNDALTLLAKWAGMTLDELEADPIALEVAAWCGIRVDELPSSYAKLGAVAFALRHIGSIARRHGWEHAQRRFCEAASRNDGPPIDADYHTYGEQVRSVQAALRVSVEDLPTTHRERYERLAIQPTNASICWDVLLLCWGLEELTEAEDTVEELEERSLIIAGGVNQRFIQLHDLQCEQLSHDLAQQMPAWKAAYDVKLENTPGMSVIQDVMEATAGLPVRIFGQLTHQDTEAVEDNMLQFKARVTEVIVDETTRRSLPTQPSPGESWSREELAEDTCFNVLKPIFDLVGMDMRMSLYQQESLPRTPDLECFSSDTITNFFDVSGTLCVSTSLYDKFSILQTPRAELATWRSNHPRNPRVDLCIAEKMLLPSFDWNAFFRAAKTPIEVCMLPQPDRRFSASNTHTVGRASSHRDIRVLIRFPEYTETRIRKEFWELEHRKQREARSKVVDDEVHALIEDQVVRLGNWMACIDSLKSINLTDLTCFDICTLDTVESEADEQAKQAVAHGFARLAELFGELRLQHLTSFSVQYGRFCATPVLPVIASGALRSVEHLNLSLHGESSFVRACATLEGRALPQLKRLVTNCYGECEGTLSEQALCKAIQSGRLSKLEFISCQYWPDRYVEEGPWGRCRHHACVENSDAVRAALKEHAGLRQQ